LAGSFAEGLSVETVPVGHPGNAGKLSGAGAGGYGPDRVCGAVAYEYRIGKHEVTAGQYTEFLNKVGGVDTYGLYNPAMSDTSSGSGITQSGGGTAGNPCTYSVAEAFVDRPVNFVSWGDAARFANWMRNGQPTGLQGLSTTEDGAYLLNGATTDVPLLSVKRKANWRWAITSEDEWYKAAYHKNDGVTGNYWDYPTGTNSMPGRNMTEATSPGNNANYYGSPFPIDSPYYTTSAGEFQLSDSAYGTFDQGGHVWEWNEAVLYGNCRGLRGGSFGYFGEHLRASYRDQGYGPTYEEDGYSGFRVVAIPGPGDLDGDSDGHRQTASGLWGPGSVLLGNGGTLTLIGGSTIEAPISGTGDIVFG